VVKVGAARDTAAVVVAAAVVVVAKEEKGARGSSRAASLPLQLGALAAPLVRSHTGNITRQGNNLKEAKGQSWWGVPPTCLAARLCWWVIDQRPKERARGGERANSTKGNQISSCRNSYISAAEPSSMIVQCT
jgi:hypothetical protein